VIAPVGGYTIWGCTPGEPWSEYETWPTLDTAFREAEGLRASRPGRMYVVLLEGDPAPEVSPALPVWA